MKKLLTVFFMITVVSGFVFCEGKAEITEAEALQELTALEVGTYSDYYGKSDPAAYAALFADKASYWDPWLDEYLGGEAVKENLMAWKGKIPNLDYEILNPRVDLYGDTAVFIFNLECSDPGSGQTIILWKGTTVFIRKNNSWEKVHAHWSTSTPPPEGSMEDEETVTRDSFKEGFPTGIFEGESGSVSVEFRSDGSGRWFSGGQGWEVPFNYGVNGDLFTEMTFEWPSGSQMPATYYWTYDGKVLSFKLWGEDARPHRQQVYEGDVYVKTDP